MDELVAIRRVSDPVLAEILVDVLQRHGVEATTTGATNAAIFGGAQFLVEIAITVPSAQAGDADEILRAHEEGRLEPDGAEGDPPGEPLVAPDALDGVPQTEGEQSSPALAPPGFAEHDPVWGPLLGLTLVHLTLLWATGAGDSRRLIEIGAVEGWPRPAQLYRLVTSSFLHFDLVHLAVNTAYIGLYGWAAIRLFGLRWTSLIYALGALASGAASAIAFIGMEGASVGASGCLFALALAVIVGRIRLIPSAPLPRREAWRVAGYGVLLVPAVLSNDMAGHLGGALVGAVAGGSLRPGRGSALEGAAPWIAAGIVLGAWAWRLAAP